MMNEETLVSQYEYKYLRMLNTVMTNGVIKQTRNAKTKSVFGMTLKLYPQKLIFPILQARKMYTKGVLGEFAAMLRGPKNLDDFKKFGCNYWDQWADKDGNLNVDYGNAWIDWNGVNQVQNVVDTLKNNPNDRRMIVSGWRPDLIPEQSLPCCHMLYQWYVVDGCLEMIWYQRSVDMMVGLPSDVILAYVWNVMLANEVGLKPGAITFMLGDCHVYEQHFDAYEQYKRNLFSQDFEKSLEDATYKVNAKPGKPLLEFLPEDISINFNSGPKVNLEVLS